MRTFSSFNESEENDQFVLLKTIGKAKKGKVFNSFGGLIRGVVLKDENGKEHTLSFDDSEWFKYKTKKVMEQYNDTFDITYYNHGQRFTDTFTIEQAKEKLIEYGYSKREVELMSDNDIRIALTDIFNI